MYRKIITLAILFLFVFAGCRHVDEGDKLTENTPDNTVTEQEETSSNTEIENNTENSSDTQIQEEEDTQNSTVLEEKEVTLYAQGNVNVRSLPSTNGEKLGVLTTNQEVTGLGESVDGWQKIRYKDGIAYVSAKYLAQTKLETSSNQTTEPQKQVDEITAEDLKLPADFDPNGIVVVIDAGHQGKGNSGKEPDGPGSSVLKAKVSSGATGCVTKQKEYVLNLEVSLKLRDELKARGYQVVMIREDHAINISNSERAKFANSLDADAFIRIHANSSNDSSTHGVETLCQTASNPYNAHLYADSRKLSDCILDEFVESTGAKKRRVWETDTMSGINWCDVPVTIVEMGFLSNPEEDKLMASEDYQYKMVQGIANGLDEYFNR